MHNQAIFPILKNLVSGLATYLHSAAAGETAVGKTGLPAYAYRDSSGNFVMPMLNSEGAMIVSSEGAGIAKGASASAEITGSLTDVDVVSLPLSSTKVHGRIYASGSCLKEAVFYLYQVNNGTETLIGSGLTGPGNYNVEINAGIREITTGGTGTQSLVLRAKCIGDLSDFLGSISALEFAA